MNAAEERWLGLLEETAVSGERRSLLFEYVPPNSTSSISGTLFQVPILLSRIPIFRPTDPLTGSSLGFNKAAALDVHYDDFEAFVAELLAE